MIKVALTENDFIYCCLALILSATSGPIGLLLLWYVVTHLDEIPEGEEPYFVFPEEEEETETVE